MIKCIAIITAVAVLCGCSPPLPKCKAPDPKTIANALSGREYFRSMLTTVAKSTVTGKMVADKDPKGFEKRLSRAVDHALVRYGKQWDANFAQAYSDTLSQQELSAVCAAMNENDKENFGRFADRVGADMKSKSTPLLQKAGAAVLKELVDGLAEK